MEFSGILVQSFSNCALLCSRHFELGRQNRPSSNSSLPRTSASTTVISSALYSGIFIPFKIAFEDRFHG